MGKVTDQITDHDIAFIERQHLFFVGTAPVDIKGHLNLSPKGLDCFRVISPTRVAYMDITGSGNETSAHLLENGRITFMFCAFDDPPKILRLYGKGFTILPGDDLWDELSANFSLHLSFRQFIVADIHRVQSSCGFGVPYYDYKGERDHTYKWATVKGEEGMINYRKEKNLKSLDGLPTPMAEKIQISQQQ